MKTKVTICRLLRLVAIATIGGVLGIIGPAYISGLYYSLCGDHKQEQKYLDQCIVHLCLMRSYCDDKDLKEILTYTIQRYNCIGPWDVAIVPVSSIVNDCKTIGYNQPLCPGITLDPSNLLEAPEDTAILIVHEALHDYWPYVGHNHINAREQKLYELSYALRRLH